MGCAVSVYRVGGNKKPMKIPVVTVFAPSLRVPVNSSFQKHLRGIVPKDLSDRLTSFRNQIPLLAQQTDVSAIPELLRSLEDYLSLVVGLTDEGFRDAIDFKWKSLDDGRQDISVADSWFELLCVVHMMGMLTLMEANSKLVPDQYVCSETVESTDDIRSAVDLLVKAAGYLQFCLREILVQIPPDIKMKLPVDLQENLLEAAYIQALGQGTEMQLASAVDCKNATLSVKRRLACEQLSYFSQAHYCLSTCGNLNLNGYGKKHLSFIKWKYLEAKAAAYYYHGLITDKGTEPSCHISAVCCFLAAEEILTESKKACLNFCLTPPITRAPTAWGAMKHLNKKIPEIAAKKSQMYAFLLEEEKSLQVLPELPEFELSLKADEYQMPNKDAAWESEKWKIPAQTLKTHLTDDDDEEEDDK